MLKRNWFLFLFIVGINVNLIGQQDPQISQYYLNQQFYNPASINNQELPKVQLLHRSQYNGYISNFDDGGVLNTQLLSFQMPLKKAGLGVGLVIINDQAGLEKNQQLKFSVAKDLKISKGALTIGISAGFYNKSFDDKFRPRESADPSIPVGGISQIKPDFGIGINYSNKYIFGGIGINHINNPTFDFGSGASNNLINRTVNGILGAQLNITEQVKLKPNLLFRSDLQTYNLEGGLLMDLKNKYWAGLNYRKDDAVILMVGTNILNNTLNIGAAYDFVIVNPKVKSNSSFEIMASYTIGKAQNNKQKTPPKIPIIRTPRYRF